MGLGDAGEEWPWVVRNQPIGLVCVSREVEYQVKLNHVIFPPVPYSPWVT